MLIKSGERAMHVMGDLPILEVKNITQVNLPKRNSKVDVEVVGVFQDASRKALPPRGPLGEIVEKLRKSGSWEARCGSLQFLRFVVDNPNAENVLFLGLGERDSQAEGFAERFRVAGSHAYHRMIAEKLTSVAVDVETFGDEKGSVRNIQAFAEGMILCAYQFKKYKSKSETHTRPKVFFYNRDRSLEEALEKMVDQVTAIGESVRVTRDWSNEPSNVGTPTFFANEAKKLARQHGLKCRILTEADARREKMGLFLGVSQGSEQEAKLVVVEYLPKKAPKNVKATKTVALVGKGVTFDSGGISLKPGLRMEEMKHDMTGAATVMGAVLLASKWKVSSRVLGIMAFTENMPDGKAIQPGNVLHSRSGKTVEIINTDAEGRLVLGDALDFAQDYKPDAVVDVATLTGAISIALGKYCCGIFGNDQSLVDSIRKAGDFHSERTWQLPLYDDYFDDLRSDTADMKNSANDGYGGAIRGAIFLKQFIKKGTSWAHLDIAATAAHLNHLAYYPKKGASGSYVRTLAQFIADF